MVKTRTGSIVGSGWLLAAVAVGIWAPGLWAQGTTGKVEGRVLDPAGQSVNGAQVTVLGTSLGAVTDDQGYFFINNVPVGTHTLRSQYIGFQPSEARNVRVQSGQTLTVSFSMSTAVAIGGINVVVEQAPIVPRDQVTSKPIVSGETVSNLPTDDIRAALAIQPGVVETGRADGLIVRGGRAGEAAVYVDGALVRSVQTGASELEVGTNALEEASITTGAFGAEFGDAQSGIIAYVTRAGGSRLQGSFSYQSDEPFGNDIRVGFNRWEGSVGGPVFGNLTFFLSGTLEGQEAGILGKGAHNGATYVLGGIDTSVTIRTPFSQRVEDSVRVDIPLFVQFSGDCDPSDNAGFECQGRRRPYNWSTELTANGKLQYTYGRGSRMSATVLGSRTQGRNSPIGGNAFAPQRYTGGAGESRAYILNLTQQVLRGADRELSFDLNLSYQTDWQIGGALERGYELASRDPRFGVSLSPMQFLVDFDHFSDDTGPDAVTRLRTDADFDKLVSNVRRNKGTRVPYLNRTELNNSQPYRMNPYAFSSSFPNQGLDFAANLFRERRMTARANIDLQLDRYNRFKFGADGQTGRVNRFLGGMIEQIFMEAYAENPRRFGAYGEDRLDLGDVVIVLGLRWDYFDTGALIPSTPGRIFTLPGVDPDNPEATMVRVKSHAKLSPRVQVSFPVTERTGFRLSYSHQAQTPDFGSILQGINNDIVITNSNDVFSGDVDFSKSIQFEFGIRHAFNSDMVLDIAAFNKDKVSDLAVRTQPFFDPGILPTGAIQNYNVLTNSDFGNVRGVDLSLVRRIGNYFNGSVAYTFQLARGTGSDPFSYLNTSARQTSAVTGERVDPPQAILPTDDNRIHNFTGSVALSFPSDYGQGKWYGALLRNVGAFAKFRFQSGLPYTRIKNEGAGQTAPFSNFGLSALAVEPINASTMPWTRGFDLRVTKSLQLGFTDVTLFGDFRNLFNVTNVISVFLETGDIANDVARGYREKITQAQVDELESKAGSRLITIPDPDDSRGPPLNAVDLRPSCTTYPEQAVNCVLLQRTEARYGNGDQIFDEREYQTAFNAFYDLFNGTATKLGAPRHIRVGAELNF